MITILGLCIIAEIFQLSIQKFWKVWDQEQSKAITQYPNIFMVWFILMAIYAIGNIAMLFQAIPINIIGLIIIAFGIGGLFIKKNENIFRTIDSLICIALLTFGLVWLI